MIKINIERLKKILKEKKSIVIIPHKNPDGDALGACLALKIYLERIMHSVDIISPNSFSSYLSFLPGSEFVINFESNPKLSERKLKKADLIFFLDFNKIERAHTMYSLLSSTQTTLCVIDHHQNPDNFDIMYCDDKISSTSELLMIFFEEIGLLENFMDKSIATCLYTGIMTDTGCFRFPSTTSKTMISAARCMDAGVNHSEIYSNVFESSNISKLRLLSVALKNMVVINKYYTSYIFLSRRIMEENNYQDGDTEGFVNYGLTLRGIKFSVLFKEQIDCIRISFRSKGEFSVQEFAYEFFSGGGHFNAAGGVSFDNMEITEKYFLNCLEKCHPNESH